MTLSQLQKRVDQLEETVEMLVDKLDHQESVAAIRAGLNSANRGEGQAAAKVFARLRRKHKIAEKK